MLHDYDPSYGDEDRARVAGMGAGKAWVFAAWLLCSCSRPQHVVVDPPEDELHSFGFAFENKALDCAALCGKHLPPGTALDSCKRVRLRYDIIAGPDHGVMCDYR